MKDKIGIYVGIGLVIVVILSMFFYVMNTGTIELNKIFPIAVAVILVVFALYVFWDRIKNVQKGLPAKDERLTNINYKAGYFGFIAAIWGAVGGPLIADIILGYELEGHYVTAIVVLVSGFVFVISYLYLARKGNKP